MRDVRKLLLAAVLAALAAGSWWLTHQAEQPAVSAGAKTRHEPDYVIENFVAREMNERGTPKYVLTAKRLRHYPDDDTAHFDQPLLVQYLPGGVNATTRADNGVMPGDGREIVMSGNVHATRTPDGRSAGGEMVADRMRVALDR